MVKKKQVKKVYFKLEIPIEPISKIIEEKRYVVPIKDGDK